MKTPDDHLALLRRFQAWRLGDDELEQPDPREITAALDWAIAVLSEGERIDQLDFENLQHMLGIGSHRKKRSWGYRNYFVPGTEDMQSMERLEKLGLVRKGRPHDETYIYHATTRGCEIAGLSAKKIAELMKGERDDKR